MSSIRILWSYKKKEKNNCGGEYQINSTFWFSANAGKIAESKSEEKCGDTSLHPWKKKSQNHEKYARTLRK